jgi:hypothetical protein
MIRASDTSHLSFQLERIQDPTLCIVPRALPNELRSQLRPNADTSTFKLLQLAARKAQHPTCPPLLQAMAVSDSVTAAVDFTQRQVNRVVPPQHRQQAWDRTADFAAARPLLFVSGLPSPMSQALQTSGN